MELVGFGAGGWGGSLLSGLFVTMEVAILALPLGLFFGLMIALGRRSKSRLLRTASAGYANAFQAIPELLTIFAIYHGCSHLIQLSMSELDVQTSWTIPGVAAGSFALSLVFAAYSSEIWMGALAGIGRGQYEAAMSLGLPGIASLRIVILPQAFRLALPGLGNLWIILLKDTALVSLISVSDFMREVNLAVAATHRYFALYLFACLGYILLTKISEFVLERLNLRASRHLVRVA
ncbi:MAG: ABC transporter permease subunit [Mesorhizobium sp.]|uniref:ABC transporter permease subunit n=1 Tax=Mesorhizobium sp. TaxID=1871066 RepID=UPI001AC43923|nr:ABC transporter permease subunit [Mesorhizobium sp.]MBN9221317.1 ABC transporter permease subunit [Mesorhizobium sp.]